MLWSKIINFADGRGAAAAVKVHLRPRSFGCSWEEVPLRDLQFRRVLSLYTVPELLLLSRALAAG